MPSTIRYRWGDVVLVAFPLSDMSGLAGKLWLQADQKDLICEARKKSMSGGVLGQYVGARRSSATKQMSLFQQPAKDKKTVRIIWSRMFPISR